MEKILTPCIIQSFMILTSIVLIVYMLLKFRDKWQKPKDCEHCKKDKNYHTMYISGYFILIIVLFFTYDMVKQDADKTLFEYFSFASVIVSIILAVLTIVYSYYTNSRSSGQAEKINDSSEEIKEASKQVIASSQNISNDSKELSKNIERIIQKLDDVKESADGAKNASEMAMMKFAERDTKTTPSADTTAGGDVTRFLSTISINGGFVLLSCYYSKSKAKEFSFKKLFESTSEYMYGFLVATAAIGYINYDIKENSITVDYIDKKITGIGAEKLIEMIIQKGKTEEYQYNIKKAIDLIKEYFEIKEN